MIDLPENFRSLGFSGRHAPAHRGLPLLSPENVREAANEIADELLRRRVSVRDGSFTWLRPDRVKVAGSSPALVATAMDLYDGIPGIAIFLAAMSHLEGRSDCRETAVGALRSWRGLLLALARDPGRAGRIRFGIGGLSGLGSFLYSLAVLAPLLEDPALLAEAVEVAGLLTAEQIAQDRAIDIVAGCSGTLLALLALGRALPPREADRIHGLAVHCGERLAAAAIQRDDGCVGWITNPLYPEQNGFAHGAAGIAYALLGLDRIDPNPRWRELAHGAWRFERTTYSAELGQWRDLTGLAPRGFLNQWCYGAPGIAIGRLGTLDVADDPAVRREIADALAASDDPELAENDHWCCGDFGRVEALLFGADRLASSELEKAATARTERLLERRQSRGRYFGMVSSPRSDPSLFSGDSGIGYTLLRLAHPGRLPCILAME